MADIGQLKQINITTEMKKAYLNYAMSVIVSRALPDVKDGLKPVHRRILYAMNELGLTHSSKYKKSATVVGEVLGKYHPHGDVPVYDAMVRLAQDFAVRYPLVDGQGNFGCFTKDTEIELAGGRKLSFEQLIEEQEKGQRHWTYAYNLQDKKIEVTEVKKPRLTRKNAELLAITLDNDITIRCTIDHKFLMRDETYVEAKNLRSGDSLMPVYTQRHDGTKDKKLKDYTQIYQPDMQKWEFVHHLSDGGSSLKPAYQKSSKNTVAQANLYNHKIKNIIFLFEREDTYDITTAPWHNFALAAGVFVHNSIDGDPPAAMRYCLVGNTLVTTNAGLKPIDQLTNITNSEDIDIKVLSKDQKIHSASKWFDSGLHPTRKITTNQGFTLTGTYNHPLLVWAKHPLTEEPIYAWKLLQDIMPGDVVVLDRSKDILWPENEIETHEYIPQSIPKRWEIKQLPQTVTPDLSFILGSILAKGTLGKDKIEFCNGDFIWIEAFKTAWTRTFPDTRLHEFLRKPSSYGKKPYSRLEIHSHYVIQFLQNIGLLLTKSPTRSIPWAILQSPKNVVASFLQGYFEGDGSISHAKKMTELSCISMSEILVSQLQVLLLRFGIVATKRYDRYRNTHKLYIRGRKNYVLFQQQINFFSERKKDKLELALNATPNDHSLFDRVPFLRDYVYDHIDKNQHYDNVRAFTYKHNFDQYGTMQQNASRVISSVVETLQPQLQNLFSTLQKTNYLYDKVISVEEAGEAKVYSIRVDSDCHSFVANGFINHNTEARMASITSEMMTDIDKETVDFIPNFDASLQEPVVLPAKLPNLLLLGAEGIAVGMATKIPPHNLGEVIDAIMFLIGRTKIELLDSTKATPTVSTGKSDLPLTTERKVTITSDVTVDELLEHIKGPDFPTAGSIYDIAEIRNAYVAGRGRVLIRGKAEIEEIGNGKSAIIITELPYQVNKALLVAKIADLAKEKKIEGISDLRDESDRRGLRVYVELKRDASPKKVLNNLFKHTALQTSFSVNMVALVDGTPQTLNLKIILEEYLKHRYHVIRRRSEFELRQAKAREHILEGLKIAVDHIDAVIKTIRESETQEAAKQNLMTKFKLSEIQSVAILDMQLRRLAALERQKIEDELQLVRETIAYLEDLLSHPEKIMTVIQDELKNLKQKYADPRRTRVFKSKVGEFSEEDLIPNEPTVITLTDTGYIKRQSLNSFQTQNRGGKGIRGMTTKEEDSIGHIQFAQTHDNILFFTNRGKAYQLKAYEIAESSRISKGTAIVNLLNIESGERVESFVTYNKTDRNTYVFLTTKNGTVKKSAVSEFENIRKGGMIAIKLDGGDELAWSDLTDGKNDVLLITKEGKAIRFSEKAVRPMGRATMGVRGIKISSNDEVIGMDIIPLTEKRELLTLMENGLGKRTDAALFHGQSRGGQGVKVANVTDKTGKVVVAQVITPNTEEVIITSKKGQIVKLSLNSIPRLGRDTQGVILMRFTDKTEKVASATCIEKAA